MFGTLLATTEDNGALPVEEPATHLHLGALRYLLHRMRGLKRQVFITTHSPVALRGGSTSVDLVSLVEGRTLVGHVTDAGGAAVLSEIGTSNRDLLLSDAVLFVEGPSDGGVISAWRALTS